MTFIVDWALRTNYLSAIWITKRRQKVKDLFSPGGGRGGALQYLIMDVFFIFDTDSRCVLFTSDQHRRRPSVHNLLWHLQRWWSLCQVRPCVGLPWQNTIHCEYCVCVCLCVFVCSLTVGYRKHRNVGPSWWEPGPAVCENIALHAALADRTSTPLSSFCLPDLFNFILS